MEDDRRVPSNSDILVAIGGLKTDVENIKKDVAKTEKNIEKIANNNVNQWKAITEINTRCEEHLKMEDTRLSNGFTLKSVLLATLAGGTMGLLCNLLLPLFAK